VEDEAVLNIVRKKKKKIPPKNIKKKKYNYKPLIPSKTSYIFSSGILSTVKCTEPEFVNLLRSPGIDSQPDGINSWASLNFTNTVSGTQYL
jgi:hypothetical protein